MAVTVTARGTNTHNSSATSFTLSPSGSLAAGSMAVLVIAADNAHANGTAFTSWTVTDDQANLWVRRVTPLYDPGLVNEGVTGAQFTTDMAGGTLTSSSVITVTFDTATTAKAWALWEVVPDSANKVISYVASGVNTGSATTTPTVTTSSITTGDVVIGGLHNEYGTAQTVTQDGDATNGSWSAQQTSEVGTTSTGMTVSSQYKVVTGTATQQYNPTLGTSSDVILSWIQLRQIPFLQVGAVDQTAYVLHESMSLKFNTFDFSLKNPATVPANGDAVTFGGPPAWAGTVVSVETVDYTAAYKRVNITASNTDAGLASAGPFGLSDAPNNTTTFGYRDMSVRVQTNIDDATQTTSGSCTIMRAGLWPAMTFELTSANRGYSAQSFSVRDVTVTWPKKSAPVFRVDFGDPLVTMSVWVASQAANAPLGSIDGTRITDGSVTTPKLATNITITNLLVDSVNQFTGGPFLRGDATYLKIDQNGAAASTQLLLESTAGFNTQLLLREAGDSAARVSLAGDAGHAHIAFGSTSAIDSKLARTGTKTLTFSDASGGALTKVSIPGALEIHGAASFPGSPATNDLFYRTDLDMWFYYDGTRWLSTNEYAVPCYSETAGPINANTYLRGVAPHSLHVASTSFFYTRMALSINVAATHDATHYWDITVYDESSGVIFTGSTSWGIVGAAATWGHKIEDLGGILSGTTAADGAVSVRFLKNSTPGDVTARATLYGRIIAT